MSGVLSPELARTTLTATRTDGGALRFEVTTALTQRWDVCEPFSVTYTATATRSGAGS